MMMKGRRKRKKFAKQPTEPRVESPSNDNYRHCAKRSRRNLKKHKQKERK
jgi:hypothetical protein